MKNIEASQVAESGPVPPAQSFLQTRIPRRLRPWLVPLFYLAVAIAFTWPLVLHLGDRIVLAESGDAWVHLWNSWWARFSLLNLHTHPYTTPLLFWPTGVNLFFHALDPFNGYLSTPFQLLFGLVAAFNLVIFFELTLAGYGTFLLARYLTGQSGAALVAGLIYALSPLESRLLNLGQLELTSIQWLPLFALCFIKMLNREARPWLWRTLSVGLLLVLAFTTWYYLLYALLFAGVYVLYQLFRERGEWRKRWPGTLALSVGVLAVFGVLIAPVLLPTLREASSGSTQQPLFAVIYNSATLKGLFTTGPSALWGWFGSGTGNNPEFRGNFLGYVTLALALLGLVSSFRRAWFWALIGVLFGLLALGPVFHLSFDPDWTPATAQNGPSLPGRLLYSLPFGNIARVPLRFALVTMLALAVLAAYGLAWATTRLERRRTRQDANSQSSTSKFSRFVLHPSSVIGLSALLVFLEFLPGARILADTSVPSFYAQIRDEGRWDDFAVLETPDSSVSVIGKAMYYQTVHNHPMVEGYVSRKPDYPFQDFPGIKELRTLPSRPQRDIIARESLHNALGLLQYYKIRYVILHPDYLKKENDRFNAADVLGTVFGAEAKPYYQGEGLQVWRVPAFVEAQAQPDAGKLLPQLAEGWGERTEGSGGIERSVAAQARLALFNPYRKTMTVRVTTRVRTSAAQASLAATFNGQNQTGQSVSPGGVELNYNLSLPPGLSDLRFSTDRPVLFSQFNFANT